MLEALLTIGAVGVGFSLFVWLLSGTDQVQANIAAKKSTSRAGLDREDPRLVFKKEWTAPVPRPRICPLCGTYLERTDYLFAAMGPEVPQESVRKRQVQIYGCPYCFGSQKEAAQLQRTSI